MKTAKEQKTGKRETRDHIKAEIYFAKAMIERNFVYTEDEPIPGTFPTQEAALAAAKAWVGSKLTKHIHRWVISEYTLEGNGWMPLMEGK